MKKISLFVLSIFGVLTMQAQDYTDALRYSETFVGGDARFMAMGGALSSLGANISAMSVNPASSAVFKKSVVEFTPTYFYTKSENNYNGGEEKVFKSSLKIPNIGIVGYKPMKQNSVFVSGLAYGFALNAQNRYDESISYISSSATSSLTDDFVNLYNNNKEYADYNALGWGSYLIDKDTEGKYFSDYTQSGTPTYGEYQDVSYEREGAKREFLFNFGVDFSEWVFVGVDLSFMNFNYNEVKSITEKDKEDVFPYLNRFNYSGDLDVSGSAVGGKFGIIARPIEYIRIGGAIHTPMVYSISEDYETQISAYYDQDIDPAKPGVQEGYATYTNGFDYKVSQPAKFVGSLGFVYKNIVNVGVDIETMDYSQCSLRSDTESMSEQNSKISDELTKVTNLKAGAEFRYGPLLFRGGYATYGNPYENWAGDKFYRHDISAGVGLATNTFYYDLTWVHTKAKQYNTLYNDLSGNAVTANSTIKRECIMFTAGFKF